MNLKTLIFTALVLVQCPARAWLPNAWQLDALCRLSQWEEWAAPLLEEADKDIRQWLVTPIGDQQGTPLHICARHGNLGLLLQLLLRVPRPDRVALLLRTDKEGNTPLHLAARNGHLPVVQCLLGQGTGTDAVDTIDGTTPLHSAAATGHLQVVQRLLAYGAEVNAVTSYGTTPLYRAARDRQLPVVQCLLAHGAGTNTASSGITPLHQAANPANKNRKGCLEMARCLVAHGAEVNAGASEGSTPLHFAATGGHLPMVQYLLAHDAAVNAVTSGGITPLHEAAENGHLAVVQCLLTHGAALDAVTSSGLTPSQMAARNGHQDIVRLLGDPSSLSNSPHSLQRLVSFEIWRLIGRHIERLRAMFADPDYPLPPGLLAVMLAELDFSVQSRY